MIHEHFWLYLAVTAGTTYLIRMLPLVLMRGKIRNRFVLSFLHYVPYAVLSVMTVPAIFYAVEDPLVAIPGFVVAVCLAWKRCSLTTVAAGSCLAVLIVSLLR